MTLHPLRCETCNYAKIEQNDYDGDKIIEIFCTHINEPVSFSHKEDPPAKSALGCGSHSNLDKFITYLNNEEEDACKNKIGARLNKEQYDEVFFEGVENANKFALREYKKLIYEE